MHSIPLIVLAIVGALAIIGTITLAVGLSVVARRGRLYRYFMYGKD